MSIHVLCLTGSHCDRVGCGVLVGHGNDTDSQQADHAVLCMLNMSGWSPNTSQPFLPLPSHAAVQSIKYHNVSF